MTNKLYVGFSKNIELPKGGFLFIDDKVPKIPRARVFELAPKLRQSVLLIEDKSAAGTTADDAEELATCAGLLRGTNGYNAFVEGAIAGQLSFPTEAP